MTELRIFIPLPEPLAAGASKVFRFRRGAHTMEGFVLCVAGKLVAFANECPHWNVDLDLGDGRFWDPSTERVLCRNHGALFHPETGVCEAGPCVGSALEAFPLERAAGGVWVTIPNASPEDVLGR